MKSYPASLVWRMCGVALVVIVAAVASAAPWLPFFRARARCREATEAVRAIRKAAIAYRQEVGRWPVEIRDLLSPERPPGAPPPFCVLEPMDPWGHRYLLVVEGDRCSALCLGRDNQRGGSGEDADIVISAE